MINELDKGWQLIDGRKPIFIVAGHNFGQGRNGEIKMADLGTGDIARNLCDKYGFWGIVSTKMQMDPNWYFDSPFREKIRNIISEKKIKLVIDIHGKNLAARELVELKGNKKFKEKYYIKVNEFINNNQETLAEELDDLVPVLQLEIREDGRVRTIDETKFIEAEKIINDLIEKLI